MRGYAKYLEVERVRKGGKRRVRFTGDEDEEKGSVGRRVRFADEVEGKKGAVGWEEDTRRI